MLLVFLLVGGARAFSFGGTPSGAGTSKTDDKLATTDATDTRRTFLTKTVGATTAAVTSALGSVPSPSHATTTNLTHPLLGKKAPSFTLPNSRGDGSTTSLESLISQKKWTVLYFYPGAFTQGCTLEARNFQRDIDKYRKLGAQIVGVSVDPPEKNASFCSSEGLDFFMLSDIGGILSKKYGSALSIPGFGTFSNRQTYIIDPDGNLRWVFTDVESRVPRHSAEVIAKLEEITGKTVSA